MKTSMHRSVSDQTGTLSGLVFLVVLIGTLFAPLSRAANWNESFQYKTLFNPTPAQLRAEDRGRVMIYDGLDNAVVACARDEQFDRIEHMMFIRTRQSSLDDAVNDAVNDDGC